MESEVPFILRWDQPWYSPQARRACAASLWLTDYSQVDSLSLRYKIVNFGVPEAELEPGARQLQLPRHLHTRERIFIELMTSERKLKVSREDSK